MQVSTPDNLGLNAEAVSDALHLLRRKGQIVLAGPPGTGKTLLAQELATRICDGDDARWRLIQLHPSYSYEDFMSGLRPRSEGEAGFLVQPGHLLRILLEAECQPGKDFCMVIDEFNRAKLAAVLGELLTMLGGSRRTASRVRIRDAPAFQAREEWRRLASPIHMPPNLYLICTMNTADRSIAAFDAALQRRFGMVQMVPCLISPREEVPNPELLLPYSDENSVLRQRCLLPHGECQELGAALDAVNAKLDELGFEPGERVGHSYFLSSDCSTQHHVRAAWREGVIPYLDGLMQDRSQGFIDTIEREHSILARAAAPLSAPAPAAGLAAAAFVASQSFTGPRPGYAFKSGSQGLGYHRDSSAAAPPPAQAAPAVPARSDKVRREAKRLADRLSVPGEDLDVIGALEGWLSQLHGSKTHALLFAGPPGCGKSFTAEALARVLVNDDSECWETITFSPSYSYEEFMVGVRPDPSQPGKYKLQKGVLLEMAARCTPADGQRRRCVLVIDEFNRAKLPQVMGECLNMLEYRGRKVDLRDNTQASLPDELYVIAMMNNADRSIEPLDSALRRRFATVTVDATKEPFRSIADGALQSRFENLSNVASRMLTFLATAHAPGMLQVDEQIGVCFFCDAADELKACATVAEKRTKLVSVLKQVWAVEVGPYVELHCVGQRVRLDKVKVAWGKMVDGISGDASGDLAPAPTVTAQPSTQGSAAGGSQSTNVLAGVDCNDPAAVIELIGTRGGSILVQAIAKNPALKDNYDVVKAAVEKAPLKIIPLASLRLKNDKRLVTIAVTKVGNALEFASEPLRNDREVVWMAVRQNGSALKHAGVEPRNDRDVVLAAVEKDGSAPKHAGVEPRNDRDVVLAAVEKDGSALKHAGKEPRNDRDVVLAAVKQNGYALRYAGEELRNDREFVLAAVKQSGCALEHASEELKKDRYFMLAAVEKNGHSYRNLLQQYAVARDVESWLGLQPALIGGRKLGTLSLGELRALCRKADIAYDDRSHDQGGDTRDALCKKICAKLKDTGLKRDRSSGSQSRLTYPEDKRHHGAGGEEGQEA